MAVKWELMSISQYLHGRRKRIASKFGGVGKNKSEFYYQEGYLLKVKDIMTKNVAYIKPDCTVTEAAKLMQQHNVGAIPVCDKTGVVGVVTDRDIVVRNVVIGSDPKSTPVSNIMTTKVATVTSDTDISQLSSIMSQNQIRRIPVVDNNTLVGIVALGDLAVDNRFDTEASDALTDISRPVK
jgi:CBS domain-containing protein